MTFLQLVLDQIEKKDISKNKLLTDLGINKNAFVNWEQHGNIPSGDIVAKIADYFGVTTDYLLGRTELGDPAGLSASAVAVAQAFDKAEPGVQEAICLALKVTLPPEESRHPDEAM